MNPASAVPSSATVLVVEDDPAIRELVRLHLSSANYDVRTADDGAKALEIALSEQPPDLIVSDISMPAMDGFALLAAIRGNESTSSIPLIFLSALDDRDSFRRGMDLGADDFLNKPVRRNDLLNAVSGRLKRLQRVRDSQKMAALTQTKPPTQATAIIGGGNIVPNNRQSQPIPPVPQAVAKTDISSHTQLMRAVAADEVRVNATSGVVRRQTTGSVLFSDIREFARFSEILTSNEVADMLNAYFSKACEPILDQNGWIVKFVGDGLMAMFESPGNSKDHAERALKAGLLMILAAHRFKRWVLERFPGRGLPEFAVGIGVYSGEVTICRMGADKASETTIIGDTVNVASRLESKTKDLGWSIVAGRSSASAAGARFRTHRAGQLVVKGRVEPVDIVEIIGLAPRATASATESQFYDMISAAVTANAAVLSSKLKAALTVQQRMTVAPSQPIPAKLAGDVPIVIPGYRLKRKLGEGGMSVVFLADNEESGQEHVLKLMRIGDDEDGDQLQRFISEFALLSQIRHPNVAHIFAQGFSEHHAYIAMEYFPGGDLRLMIEKGMQPDVVLAVLLQVAGALGAIHAEGIVHRDMKPDNVMIRSDGTLALADFGIAKQLNSNMNRTKHGEVFGTPYYLSPEQALGLPVDTRTDIYSLGVMFYEMLTGKKPYRGDNPQALLYQHVNGPMPKLPDELLRYQHLVDRLMSKKPADRMQDADEIINSVVSVINGEASTPFTLDA
jgi:serine/threonine-protein kinase PpkA